MRNDPLAPPRSGRLSTPLLLAVISAATFVSAGSVAITRDAVPTTGARPPIERAQPVAIESLIPRNVVAFVRVAINPKGADRASIERIVREIPAPARAEALVELHDQLASLLPVRLDVGAVRRVLGEQVAVAIVVVRGRPQAVTILELRDPAAARRTIRSALGRGHILEIDGRIAYAGARPAVAALRASARRNAMSTHSTYLRDLGALGGSGLAVGWFDGTRLAGVPDGRLPPAIRQAQTPPPGQRAPNLRKSRAVGVVFARGDALVAEVRERGGLTPALSRTSSTMELLGRAPARGRFAIGLADPATYLRLFLGLGSPRGFLPPGVDLERDVLRWLGDEIAFVMLPDDGGVGISVELADEGAFAEAFDRFAPLLRTQQGFMGDSRAFSVTTGGQSIVMRRESGALAIGVSKDGGVASRLVTDLLRGAGSPLSRDRDYRASFVGERATARWFARIGDGFPLFGGSSEDAPPSFLRSVRTFAYEVHVEGSTSISRLVVTFGS